MNIYLELAKRFDQIGLKQADLQHIPTDRMFELVGGRILLVIIRKPHCPRCGEDTFIACSGPRTKLPLEKLFPSSK